MHRQEKHYAALAPIMALAGIFAHPVASTLLPLLLFFIYYWRQMEFSQLVALRAADLAFSTQLFLVSSSLLLSIYLHYFPTSSQDAQNISIVITLIILSYLVLSLIAGIIQVFRGKSLNYPLSLRIAERVYRAIQNRTPPVD